MFQKFFKSRKKNRLRTGISALLTLGFLVGCGSSASAALPDCPFSDLTWTSSVSEMEQTEGSAYVSYDSVYGGTTYTYTKSYKKKEGTVKYMFDDKEQLASIAWAFGSDSAEELYDLYEAIHEEVVAAYGESGYNTEKETNYGDVWYLEGGNIILSTMLTNDQKALQFAFVSPAQSTKAEDVYKSSAPDIIK